MSRLTSVTGLPNLLEAQSSWEVSIWQTCHKLSKKSSKIVPLGAPALESVRTGRVYHAYRVRAHHSSLTP